MLDAIHVFILTHMVEAHSYERCFDGLSGWRSQTQKRDRTRVLEYPHTLRRHFTETAVRDRAGTSRCRSSHTAHTESHGLKPRDRHRNPSQQNTQASRARPRGRKRSWQPCHRQCPPRSQVVSELVRAFMRRMSCSKEAAEMPLRIPCLTLLCWSDALDD